MARIISCFIPLILGLTVAPAFAQAQTDLQTDLQTEPAGYWTGVLDLNGQAMLRVGIDIVRDEDGTLTGTLDSPDQNAFDIPLTDVSLDYDVLSFSIAAINASYQGAWELEKQGWDGFFTQAGASFPLLLRFADKADRPEPVPLPANWTIPDDAALGAMLEKRIAGRPGEIAVLGLSDSADTRIVARGPDGEVADAADVLFEIGSMTKVFTSLLLADMALKGELSLDDPVAKFLPGGAVMPTRAGLEDDARQITLRNLSLQNSGLPRLPDNMPYGDVQDPYADYTEAMLLEFLASYELTRDIGSEYEYSNLGVGLLGYALARAGGSDFEALVTQRILAPLGMSDTAITLSPEQQARFATPHDEYMRPTKPWSLPALAGAGALRSTAADMLKFLRAALDPNSPIGAAMALTSAENLGWMVATPPTGEVLHHGGGTGGFRTHMALQADTRRAVVVLTNAAIEPSAQDLAFHTLSGAPLANEIPVPPAPAAAPDREEVTLTATQMDHVTGDFQLAPGVVMNVARDGDGLTAQLTGQPRFPLFASAPLEFFLRVVDARVVFNESNGAVTAVVAGATLFQNGREIPMMKIEQD